MASPPLRRSKRKRPGKIIQEGAKRFRTYLQPPSSDDDSTSASSLGPASAASSRPPTPSPSIVATTSRSPTPGTGTGSSHLAPTATGAGAKHGAASRLKRAATSGLVSALQALHIGADLIPPLKPAISGLVECLDIVQAATANAEEYHELTSKLSIVARALKDYLGELGLETASGNAACEHIASSIQTEVTHIKNQQARSKASRVTQTADDKEDVIRRYRRVEELFSQLQNEVSLQTLKNVNKQHMAALLERMSPVDDARFNSGYSTTIERRGCTKETREQVQADIQHWVQDPDGAKVYWMNGMAGTGKTTIAYSLCEWLEANRKLGASFFCSRASPSCRNVNSIIPTIAYELARYSSSFRAALCKVLEQDPGASKLNVVKQFEKLIRDPLGPPAVVPAGVVIVIDALDECEGETGVRLVLQVLLRLSIHLPLKFFVTSRPEPTIRDRMLSPSGYSPTILHLQDIERSIVEGDIKKYLAEELEFMSPPPSDKQINRLSELAGKLFIYAATVTRYILPGTAAVDSMARLDAVLTARTQAQSRSGPGKRYEQLDDLYTTVLGIALNEEKLEDQEIMAVRRVLWTVVCAKEPMTINTLASFLSLDKSQVLSALRPLRSVIHISEPGGLVSTFHASFLDYILNASRSGRFNCKHTLHHELMTNRCFALMKDQLRFNICNLKTSSILDKDVPELERQIENNVSPALLYACLYWGGHLHSSSTSHTLHDELVDFFAHRLLFWMEVLNVGRNIANGITILSQAQEWLLSCENSEATQQSNADAKDFITRFAASKCSGSTPHIYISALPFCDKFSSVYARYWGRTRGLIDLQGTVASRRSQLAQATWTVGWGVTSIAISSDAERIICGDHDGNIQIRDGQIGEVIDIPFPKNADAVASVALSPDGTRLVTGFDLRYGSSFMRSSYRGGLEVWDTTTGEPTVGPFGLFLGAVSSVAFSPDGKHIVSSSENCRVRLWDTCTGNPIFPSFYGHTDTINAIALSPDSTSIASCSHDHTIRVWSTTTGGLIAGPFQGHTGSVDSVAFSPDGTLIVSGSHDETIRLWDARTGDIVSEPLRGHTGPVNSVVFSPDGEFIASGSSDATILIWDAHTGRIVAGPLHGHEGLVKAVSFSPDGIQIVSGSSDGTVLMWGAKTNAIVAGPLGRRTESVNSVAFSHDGTSVVWGSDGGVIQVWTSHTCDVLFEAVIEHEPNITSVAFSCDDTYIVSGSNGYSIRIWDARTGCAAPTGCLDELAHQTNSIAVSRNGRWVAFCSDTDIQVWDTSTDGLAPGPFQGHLGPIESVVFSPDGTLIASASRDNTIRVWNTSTGNSVAQPFRGHTGPVLSVFFSRDGQRIASGSADRTVRVWSTHTGDLIAGPFYGHTQPISSVVFSPDGSSIASGSDDSTLRVWDAYTGNTIAGPFRGHKYDVTSIVFSPDGTRIISGGTDGTVRVWTVRSENTVIEPGYGHTGLIRAVALSPDGTIILSGSDDGTVGVWDIRTGDKKASPFEEHHLWAKWVAFSSDGSRIVILSDIPGAQRVWSIDNGVVTSCMFDSDKDLNKKALDTQSSIAEQASAQPQNYTDRSTSSAAFSLDAERIAVNFTDDPGVVRVHNTRNGSLVYVVDPFQSRSSEIWAIAFSPNGTRIAFGSDEQIFVWDIFTGNIVAGFHRHSSPVSSITFSPDGIHIASGCTSGNIWVWDSCTGDIIAGPLQDNAPWVSSIAFSPDGRRIVSGQNDNTLRVWDICTGDLRALKGHTSWIISVAFSSDGKSIVSASMDHVIRVWDLDSDVRDFKVDYEGDGWVTDDSGLLFWAPHDFHSHLPHPCNSLLIGPKGTVFINYKNLLLGERWSECYVS